MGFTSAFKGLTTTIVAPPSIASKWQMGFNSAFKGLNPHPKEIYFINIAMLWSLMSDFQNSAAFEVA
jgi:hypothetical protein